ncbi:very long chain fatty acid elongase 6-like [Centruroides vittatus]|uniref:elongation of very long chain fatty acids protein 6-like n=1 Tax=Centruroides sculpturatus TaxID=218467 RepID=UPI000C6D1A4E|nr:elongation of very long chain fatty acids protein 6-like [Centruroides sculpturatus]XP_023221193.1 elongation of very long chain fatty acids protein 6-like [Centruroides sculpturatus]
MEVAEMKNNPSSPNYSIIFDFEKDFDQRLKREWMVNHWHQAFYYVAIYMFLVFGGQAYMQLRPPFQLRRLLTAWNVFLAVFSIFGALRTLPEFLHVLREFGFTYSVCNPSFIEETKVSGFWTWMFTLSKLPELGDTIFIILRKQNLIFLHWYHHMTVLLFAWYSYTEHIAPARWFMVMNYVVHSFMYTYYAMRAMRIHIPRSIAMMITSSQILQMIAGGIVSYWAYQVRLRGDFCQISVDTAKLAVLMYLSYFVLFAKYFYNAYILPKRERDIIQKKKSD